MMIALEAEASVTSVSEIAPAERVDHLELDLVGRQPRERVGERLDRALHVALDDDFEILDLARAHPLAQIFERDAAGLLQFAFALLGAAELGDLARLGFLGHATNAVPGSGTLERPKISTGVEGPASVRRWPR